MYKGMYVAMSGAVLRSQELDNVANNLANASTVGYKKNTFSSQLYPLTEGGGDYIYLDARAMSYIGKYNIDTTEGDIKATGNVLDLAVRGNGFFAVENKGQVRYTRNGAFSKDREGNLASGDGSKVLDTAGKPIRIDGKDISIAPDGAIYVDGNNAGKLKVVNISNIFHIGDSLFSGTETGAADGEVLQGSIEMSNVNPVREMVGIISALREYEAAQKVIQSFDELAQKGVSEIAKV